ncbi:winged helix-turn-helix transcriptional regulator [Proteiniborus sp. MB09-C3]|uniref:winged helix-turn-helix transcriptional regulator n=1 Tax=Proteiniborus sp. MB09-C3 TaxID=3050072 RepID=UPI002552B646|nr:winged helix-turn-helix transcriptional regulator [Proteiniborus sp. MB09-C3]WIV12124.1 winged helix-turn-helix transcriptional regulator [Proteiniborus sp. MB09-C3]
MDFIKNIKFFTPTAELKELTILQHIENSEDTTQKELAELVNAAPSMINVYINDYEEKGYIIREYISTKTVKYKITSAGVRRKNYLLITYLHELLKLYRLAKENIEGFLEKLEDKGYRNILLYGAGEVAETILSVIRDRGASRLNIAGIIDDDEAKKNKKLLGYKIISRDDIEKYNHDAIVITSYTYEDDIRRRLGEVGYDGGRVVRFFW